MNTKPEDMNLEELAKLQEKHKAQMDANREKVRQRKARTHKLIVIGAILVKHMPELLDMNDEDIYAVVTEIHTMNL